MIAVRHLSLDCADAAGLASFWSAALGRPVDEGASPYFASIGMAARSSRTPAWLFLRVLEAKSAKNRLHVDFAAGDRAAEVARLVGLGATDLGEHDEYGTSWTVLQDPEGNEFCVGGPSPTG